MLVDFDEAVVIKYQNDRLDEGTAPKTINEEVGFLLRILGETGDIIRARLRKRKMFKLKVGKVIGKAYSKEEKTRMLEQAREAMNAEMRDNELKTQLGDERMSVVVPAATRYCMATKRMRWNDLATSCSIWRHEELVQMPVCAYLRTVYSPHLFSSERNARAATAKGSDRTSTSSAHSVSCGEVDDVDAKSAIIGAQALFLYILDGLALAEGIDGFRQKEGCVEMKRRSGDTPSDSHSDKRSAKPRLCPTQGERDGSQRRKTSFSNR